MSHLGGEGRGREVSDEMEGAREVEERGATGGMRNGIGEGSD
jgi:hypothetical protein